MTILVTGGAGYIGSHTCIALLERGYTVVVVDNLCNSNYEAIRRVEQITGKSISFYEADLLDTPAVDAVFNAHKIDAVIHFAGLKAVGESVSIPLAYYNNNITGTLNLLEVMEKYSVSNLIFSSSATVYGDVQIVPLTEDCPTGGTTNPYGTTKVMLEQIFKDLHHANPHYNFTMLRYFNPVGAHESGLIGEDPKGIPNNLVPYITQVAIGKLKELQVFGDDYDTPDGTGVRDYIHVVDLAIGHVKALEHLIGSGYTVYNLGSGYGISVLEMIRAFEKVTDKKVPYRISPRRPGDIAKCWASPDKAAATLGFKTEKTLEEMVADCWRWQQGNPNGYTIK